MALIVSVVITAFNVESTIQEAVNSILEQDYKELKVVVVDDGSTDQTSEKLNDIQDERLVIHRFPVNCGMAMARNMGVRLSQDCEYIAVMDADDIALPHRISTQVKFLDENPDVHIVGSRIKIFKGDVSNIIFEPKHVKRDAIIKSRLLLIDGSALSHPTTMMRMPFFREQHLDYPPPTRGTVGLDHDFWISVVPYGVTFQTLPDVLLLKRRHEENVSRRSKKGGVWASLKTLSRTRLLHAYYPQMTGQELRALALLLEEERTLNLEELSMGYAMLKKVMPFTQSVYGESKDTLNKIFQQAHQRKWAISKRLGLV